MRTIKYLLCPGPIVSKNDGQKHWISSQDLIRLYRVPLNECVTDFQHGIDTSNLIVLSPQYSGDYSMPLLKE